MRGQTISICLWCRVSNRDNPNKCWEWIGTVNNKGYGEITFKYVKYLTHRVAYEVTFGPIPEGLEVLHTCDNPPCCNPSHLFVGTQQDNMDDALRKGRPIGRPTLIRY